MKKTLSLMMLLSASACSEHSSSGHKFNIEDCIVPRKLEAWDPRFVTRVVTDVGRWAYHTKVYHDGKWVYTSSGSDSILIQDEDNWETIDCPVSF